MTEPARPLDARSIRLELTVPCDTRFRPVLTGICRRMAAYLGYARHDAAVLADAIGYATACVFDQQAKPPYSSLDIRFSTTQDEVEIRVTYHREEHRSQGDPPDLQRFLSQPRNGGAPLERMRQAVSRVEFGQDDGVEFCSVHQALPEER